MKLGKACSQKQGCPEFAKLTVALPGPRRRPGKPMHLYLGLDPGLSGAVTLLSSDGKIIMLADMPATARGVGRVKHEVDSVGIARLLQPYSRDIAHGVVENVSARPGQGVASMFSLGHSFGTATAVLACLGIAFELMSAAK